MRLTKYLLFCAAALVLWACGNHSYELDNLQPGKPVGSSPSEMPVMDSRVVSYQQRIWSEQLSGCGSGITDDINILKSWFPYDIKDEQNECNYFAISNTNSSTWFGYLVLAQDKVLYSLVPNRALNDGCVENDDMSCEAILVCDDKANTLKTNIKFSNYTVPNWDCSKWETAPKKGFFPNHPRFSNVTFNVQYARNQASNGGEPTTTVISSKKEIEQYYGKQQIKICDKQGIEQGCNTTQKYSDDYFADNFLVIVGLWEPSGSIRHEVRWIDEDGNIVINRLVPEMGTTDIGSWGIIIELNNNFKFEQFQVLFIQEDIVNPPCKIAAKQAYGYGDVPNNIKELDGYKNLAPSCKSEQNKLVHIFDLSPVDENVNWDYVYSHLSGYVSGSGIVPEQGGGYSQGKASYNINGVAMTQEEYDVYKAEYWRKLYEERERTKRVLDIPCSIGSGIALLSDKDIKELKEKYDYLGIEDYVEAVPDISPPGGGGTSCRKQ
jgi:hypothetical protein